MKFSICIPNYNYEAYLGKTIQSILDQTYKNFEILISDNCSTDRSVAIIQEFVAQNAPIRYKVNATNLGFAGNLDAVAQMSEADQVIMLSSDDIIQPPALACYQKIFEARYGKQAVVSSAWNIIDANDELIGYTGPNHLVWWEQDIDAELSQMAGAKVYRLDARILLGRCLMHNLNPFHFCTLSYPKKLGKEIGGYTGGRMINPDKWFNWRLLTVADEAIFIDSPLFQYRWHQNNQTAQQANSGHLKYVTDEYRTSIEIPDGMLSKGGLNREQYHQIFIRTVILNHGMSELSKGLWLKAYRINCFGWATYPGIMLKFWPKSLLYCLLLIGGPLGIWLSRIGKKMMK